jgi:uncharacterized iron-regulated membrane protein
LANVWKDSRALEGEEQNTAMILRKLLVKIHLYLGLAASSVVIVIGLTGAALVFEQEVDQALHPHLWQVMPRADKVPLQSIVDAVRETYAPRTFLTVETTEHPEHPYVVSTDAHFQVFVNPYSGEILGAREHTQTFFGVMFALHRTLLVGEIGRTVVGVATLLVVCLVGTGLYLWWPRTTARVKSSLSLRWTAGWRRLNYDLHNVLGFYASWYLVVIALTGLVWSFSLVHDALFWLTGSPPPPWKSRPLSTATGTGAGITLDEAMRKADEAMPGAAATEIMLPQKLQDSISFVKRSPGALNPNAQHFVSLDQYTGAILTVDRYEDLSWGATMRLLVYPIHVGSIFGWGTQILALLVSVLVTVSAITGVLLWWQKQTPERRARDAYLSLPKPELISSRKP